MHDIHQTSLEGLFDVFLATLLCFLTVELVGVHSGGGRVCALQKEGFYYIPAERRLLGHG